MSEIGIMKLRTSLLYRIFVIERSCPFNRIGNIFFLSYSLSLSLSYINFKIYLCTLYFYISMKKWKVYSVCV